MLHEVTGLSAPCVDPFPLSLSPVLDPTGTVPAVPSLLLPWIRNDMFCQLLMWRMLESLCCHVIWRCPDGELVAYFLRPSRLGNVDCKLEMNSSTCCRGCFFALLNIILPFWKAFELRFSLELLMPSHYLRMPSRAWQWRWPAASVREDRTCWRIRHLCNCCIYAVSKQTEM